MRDSLFTVCICYIYIYIDFGGPCLYACFNCVCLTLGVCQFQFTTVKILGFKVENVLSHEKVAEVNPVHFSVDDLTH